MEAKLKHLEMIQTVVERMARNSFLLKGWSLTLVSALFALAAAGEGPLFVIVALFPAAFFWVLDGYFLWQERLFRALYDAVRVKPEQDIDFSMDTRPHSDSVASWWQVCLSRTLLLFHGMIVVIILIVSVAV